MCHPPYHIPRHFPSPNTARLDKSWGEEKPQFSSLNATPPFGKREPWLELDGPNPCWPPVCCFANITRPLSLSPPADILITSAPFARRFGQQLFKPPPKGSFGKELKLSHFKERKKKIAESEWHSSKPATSSQKGFGVLFEDKQVYQQTISPPPTVFRKLVRSVTSPLYFLSCLLL